MFIEACIISYGLYAGNRIYQTIKSKVTELNNKHGYKKKLADSVNEAETEYQQFVREKIDPLFGDPREAQLNLLALTDGLRLTGEEKMANRRMGLSAVNLGLAVVSALFYPPLLLLTVPFILFLAGDHLRILFKKRQLNIVLLDGVITVWVLGARYFFAGSLCLFVISLHRKLLAKTKEDSKKRLIKVFDRHPRSVWIITNGAEAEIPFEDLQAGDLFVVNAGEVIAADGVIRSGVASIDQHDLTGESQPAEKGPGEHVFASTVVLSGNIHVLAEKTGKESVAVKIGEILNRTTDHKISLESKTERIVDRSVPPTLGVSALAYAFTGLSGGLAILFSSIGYNMRIFGPMSTLNFLRIASENSILIKDGRSLEKLAEVDTVVFDKTGTLTLEQPYVNRIHSCNGLSEEALLTFAAAAEKRQTHPIARAILTAAAEQRLDLPDISDASYEIGYGIRVSLSDRVIRVGSGRFMKMENIPIPDGIQAVQEKCGIRGYSLVMVAMDGELAGGIELRPKVRPEARQVIRSLEKNGISTCIISGDREEPTRMLARKLEIARFYADTLPGQKAEIIEQLQKQGKTVCFVGDGINDAIALKKADVSVSLRGASTAAVDSAQIVLMDENLDCLTRVLDISREFAANQKTNLAISLIPGVICIGGVFFLHFGIYSAIILYYLGLALGLGNVTYPLIAHKKGKNPENHPKGVC